MNFSSPVSGLRPGDQVVQRTVGVEDPSRPSWTLEPQCEETSAVRRVSDLLASLLLSLQFRVGQNSDPSTLLTFEHRNPGTVMYCGQSSFRTRSIRRFIVNLINQKRRRRTEDIYLWRRGAGNRNQEEEREEEPRQAGVRTPACDRSFCSAGNWNLHETDRNESIMDRRCGITQTRHK
ncbi:unnamed protein product [Pleuronectes platessa]|uniref:Uncharacterized protein n=1 Tax=Pleuronectes platessa TaxID=8262 RepID=A0A9N7YDX8_PLEPL|nr:unnamed protein product [Pleuronectes platessa]